MEQKKDLLLKINNVTKIYPGVKALSNVSFSIDSGEVRALVGENGAGKSTLIRQIMGIETPDSGSVEININGEWRTPKSAIEAKELGMQANYQHVNIARELSVAENYFLGNMKTNKLGIVDWKAIRNESKKIIDKFKINVDPKKKIRELPIAMQEMITISKISINENLHLVIFDEPTALLENDKVEVLFDYIKELKSNGVGIIYVSHRIEEIMEICDTVTVLKDGTYVDTKQVEELDKEKIISMMVGREVSNIYDIKHASIGKELLKVETISRAKKFKDASFDVHEGEIVGFFGLVGAGRSEVMKCLFGADKIDEGKVFIKGEEVHIKSPKDAMRHGIGLIPENRAIEGLAMPLTIKTNVNMSSYEKISTRGIINLKKEKKRAEQYKDEVRIKTSSVMQYVMNLSGGNQQKVVISKLLASDADILIFDEPTVGVDVGAKEEIFKIIEKLIATGKGIIVISSYLPEVVGLSDRMYIMAEGEIVGELNSEELHAMEEADFLKIASKMS